MINTIGPLWDGNEVWLLTAGGATFAAFPDWYATLFSGFYLPLLLILVALIVRNLGFEYRAQARDDTLAAPVGPAPSSSARSSPHSCGAWPSPTSSAACRSTPTWSSSATSDPAQPDAPAGRSGDARPVPHPRRLLRRAEDDRPDPRTRPDVSATRSGWSRRSWPSCTCWSSASSGGSAASLGHHRRRRRRPPAARWRERPRPRGLGLRRDLRVHRVRGGDPVRRAVPGRHAVDHRPGVLADDRPTRRAPTTRCGS